LTLSDPDAPPNWWMDRVFDGSAVSHHRKTTIYRGGGMNTYQERVLQSFRRVQGWFAANPQYVARDGQASTPALAAQLDALNGVVQRVSDHAAQQQTQLAQTLLISKDEDDRRRELLAVHMASIAKVARALRGTVPGIGVLAMPKGNIESAALIGAATAMARKAEIYKAVLIENGLPVDFIQQLDGASAELKGSLDARGLARAARASATRGLQTEIALGRRIVEIMDATLLRVLRLQPAKQAEWQQLKRIVAKGSVTRGGVAPVETSPRLVESSPSLVESSPTRVESSPVRVESSPAPVATSPTQAKTAA
jgi:hypothetical protein